MMLILGRCRTAGRVEPGEGQEPAPGEARRRDRSSAPVGPGSGQSLCLGTRRRDREPVPWGPGEGTEFCACGSQEKGQELCTWERQGEEQEPATGKAGEEQSSAPGKGRRGTGACAWGRQESGQELCASGKPGEKQELCTWERQESEQELCAWGSRRRTGALHLGKPRRV